MKEHPYWLKIDGRWYNIVIEDGKVYIDGIEYIKKEAL